MDKKSERFWRQYDRASRVDFGGTLLGLFFDWKAWVSAAVGGGGGAITFLAAAIAERSPLDVWVLALVAGAALMITVYLGIVVWEKSRKLRSQDIRDIGADIGKSPVPNNDVDAGSVQLAGIVNALMERAGSYSFKLPVPDGDPFLRHHNELKNSTHPIWTNSAINQLRRDFLQFCYIVGARDEERSAAELQGDRAQLRDFGRKLIAMLKGAPEEASAQIAIDNWKGPLEAIEAFADKSLVETKTKWDEKFCDTHQQQYQSEREIAALLNSTDQERDKKLDHQRRRNEVAVIGHQIARDELQRAWADLRADLGKRLEIGELVAKGIPAPYAAGKGEIEIAPHEWRLLEINPNEKAEAIERGGGGAKYVGVVIGKRG